MKRRAATLIELMVALAVAALVATIAGSLLFKGLETWRREADRSAALRRASLATDRMAQDLAAPPVWSDLAARVTSFDLSKDGAGVSFFITGRDSREIAVCWYLSGAPIGTLFRYEATADETAAALPGNAASLNHAAAFSSSTGAGRAAFDGASLRMAEGVSRVKFVMPSNGVPQIVFTSLTAEGRSRLAEGVALESIPERCVIDLSRPVAFAQ